MRDLNRIQQLVLLQLIIVSEKVLAEANLLSINYFYYSMYLYNYIIPSIIPFLISRKEN